MAQAFVLRDGSGCEWSIGVPGDPYGDGIFLAAEVAVRADGLTASTSAILMGRDQDLGRYFSGLAADWRGWQGVRRWEALEHQVELEASHDGRARVTLAVTIRRSRAAFAADAWSARVVIAIEAGEQLSTVASDLASLLAVE